jgi:diamine N-acetyltransferase
LAEHARVEGATELLTSYRAGPDEPLGFYLKAGFEATGREEEGEQVLRLRL